jgi:hypothetical protein
VLIQTVGLGRCRYITMLFFIQEKALLHFHTEFVALANTSSFSVYTEEYLSLDFYLQCVSVCFV